MNRMAETKFDAPSGAIEAGIFKKKKGNSTSSPDEKDDVKWAE